MFSRITAAVAPLFFREASSYYKNKGEQTSKYALPCSIGSYVCNVRISRRAIGCPMCRGGHEHLLPLLHTRHHY